MSGLVKEILLDYGIDKLSIEEGADIEYAIGRLLGAGLFSLRDIQMLYAYIYGYTANEISAAFLLSTGEVELRIAKTVDAIGELLKIQDTDLINFARANKYPASKMESFKQFLKEHGLRYMQHNTPNVYGV